MHGIHLVQLFSCDLIVSFFLGCCLFLAAATVLPYGHESRTFTHVPLVTTTHQILIFIS